MQSDHFDGKHYFNLESTPLPGSDKFLLIKWLVTRKLKPFPPLIAAIQQKVERNRVEADELVVTFIGHSTFLIQMEGINILTDPIWSDRASPFSFLGPKRFQKPGIAFKDLPFIDKVLISHNHYDHLDIKTLKDLEDAYHPTFYVSQGNRSWLEKKGLNHVEELDWWMKTSLNQSLALYFVPAKHFSARGLFDRNKTLWGGFFIEGQKHRVYFAGDTGYGTHFEEIYKRLDSPTLSLLPIGAFEPREIMKPIHMNPAEAVEAHLNLRSKKSIGMHFATFQLTDETWQEPVQQLKQALEAKKLDPCDFQVMQPGEGKAFDYFI